MKKILLFALPLLVAVIIFVTAVVLLSKTNEKGALQVTSFPKSKVFLDGKEIGVTPLCRCEFARMIPVGDYTIRLVPTEGDFTPFEQKIKIAKSILTVIDRTFGKGASSEGSRITLVGLPDKQEVQLLLLSLPDGAAVFVDGNEKGKTPLLLKDIAASDHEVKLQKNGYKEKTIKIRTTLGYKLEGLVLMSVDESFIPPTPVPSLAASPSATLTPSVSLTKAKKVIILDTPTGFLRVRESASLSAPEVAKVTPGETYDVQDEQVGWTAIKLKTGAVGWVSSQYIQEK